MKNYVPIAILFCFSSFNAWTQNIKSLSLEGGINTGIRFMDLSEVNSNYGYLGFSKIEDDKLNGKYYYVGTPVKPYTNNVVISGFIECKPFKNKFITLLAQYDYMPDAKRNEIITNTYDVLDGNTYKVAATVLAISKAETRINIKTASFLIGYDIPIYKFNLNIATGVSYNAFQIAGNQSWISTATHVNDPGYPDVMSAPDKYYVYGKASGLGWVAKASLSYKLTRRLYANFNITTYWTDLRIIDYFGNNVVLEDQKIGSPDFGFIDIIYYLNAQLSGVQFNAGLSYSLN